MNRRAKILTGDGRDWHVVPIVVLGQTDSTYFIKLAPGQRPTTIVGGRRVSPGQVVPVPKGDVRGLVL